MSTTEKLLLDNASAAELLSVSPRTLVKLRDAGEIPFVRVGDGRKGVRYSTEALKAFVSKRQSAAGGSQ